MNEEEMESFQEKIEEAKFDAEMELHIEYLIHEANCIGIADAIEILEGIFVRDTFPGLDKPSKKVGKE